MVNFGILNNLKWCLRQPKGIKLIEKKNNLSKDYIKRAEESLKFCNSSSGVWKVISGYYACYEAFYSILMKCGVKCEIHDCTIKLMNFFSFSQNEINFMKKLKEKRIKVQYYLGKAEINFIEVKKFIIKSKLILEDLDEDTIKKIRRAIKK